MNIEEYVFIKLSIMTYRSPSSATLASLDAEEETIPHVEERNSANSYSNSWSHLPSYHPSTENNRSFYSL